ncbi:MAG: outer-membrane lipoprotein carrier protein LolA [Hyphomicrobiaceae bacterium]
MSVLLTAAAPAAIAQNKKVPSNPVGAGWDSKVKQAGGDGARTLTSEQMQSIDTVNNYFNNLSNLKGSFAQTNPDSKLQRGKFYLMRPGRFRFDYNRPSRQVIISDGKYLAIQDLDLKNEDIYGLENTPFRILLRENVNLLRDARIMAVEQSDTQIAITLTDKSPDSPGQITIYLKPGPEPALAGWVTTDVQGGVTKVEVHNLARPEKLDRKLFKRERLFMKSIQ